MFLNLVLLRIIISLPGNPLHLISSKYISKYILRAQNTQFYQYYSTITRSYYQSSEMSWKRNRLIKSIGINVLWIIGFKLRFSIRRQPHLFMTKMFLCFTYYIIRYTFRRLFEIIILNYQIANSNIIYTSLLLN